MVSALNQRINGPLTRAGNTRRSRFASGSFSGIDTMYVGDRCNIVTCVASLASDGMSVTAVAPEPITTTFLPL